MSVGEATGRRSILGWLVALGGGAVAALLGVPAVAYVADPLLRRTASAKGWRTVCRAAQVRDDAPLAVAVMGEKVDAWTRSPEERLGTVWLQRTGRGVTALSAECPHLGCTIRYDAAHERFKCPCHASAFDRSGRALTGPAPRAMDALEARVRGEVVEVRFARFRTRKRDRQEIG